MAVDVVTSPDVKLSVPRVLLQDRYAMSGYTSVANDDVSPDGQRIAVVRDDGAVRIGVLVNYFDDCNREIAKDRRLPGAAPDRTTSPRQPATPPATCASYIRTRRRSRCCKSSVSSASASTTAPRLIVLEVRCGSRHNGAVPDRRRIASGHGGHGFSLIYGSTVRTPGTGMFIADRTRTNMQNLGVEPDIFVDNAPEDNLAGRDKQLETAVQELLKQLGSTTTTSSGRL